MVEDRRVIVFGATGRVGGAVVREMLRRGWQVRAISRNPESDVAQALRHIGAEVIRADMEVRQTVDEAIDGYDRVLSVQSWGVSGVDGEVRQGRIVADAAKAAAVKHLVYSSAGPGTRDTGIEHFDCKFDVEDYMHDLGLPVTVLRPGPFMELMSDKSFYPALSAWGVMPKIIGWDQPTIWTAVADIGCAAANAFENPETWIGMDRAVISDVETMRRCRELFDELNGKKPFGLALPLFVFNRMAGPEFAAMWEWQRGYIRELGKSGMQALVEQTREICPEPHTVRQWLSESNED